MGYFGISDDYRLIPELDSWLRHRVRRCYWKQGRKVYTKRSGICWPWGRADGKQC